MKNYGIVFQEITDYNNIKVIAPNAKLAKLFAEQRYMPYLEVEYLGGESYKVHLHKRDGKQDNSNARDEYKSISWYEEAISIEFAKLRK